MSETLLVVDGHSLAFRAFYALPVESFTARGGQATNAIYGFLSMLARLIETEKPSHVAVAFDLPGGTFRTEEYPEYKATRTETPPDFVGQVEIIQEVLQEMGIAILTKENYEADDILATLAKRAETENMRVLVASGDRDTFQLASNDVTILYPGRSTADMNYMTPQAIEDRYGVTPGTYPDLAALVGETSDNLPGVPGVGPKTAAQWLKKFGGLKGVVDSASEIKGKRGEALREHLHQVQLNRQLNQLVSNLDLPETMEDLVPIEADYQALQQLFDTLNFTGLRDRVYRALAVDKAASVTNDENGQDGNQLELEEIVVASSDNEDCLTTWLAERNLKRPFALAFDGIGKPIDGSLQGFALYQDTSALVVDPATLSPGQEKILESFLATNPKLVMHDGKSAEHAFESLSWKIPPPIFDVKLAAYLCHPVRRDYSVDALAIEYLGERVSSSERETLFSLEEVAEPENGTPLWAAHLAQEALTIAKVRRPLKQQLVVQHMFDLLTEMEIPLQTVLCRMETDGVAMDIDLLDRLSADLSAQARRAESDAFSAIGHSANLASPKQLQVILFEELGMPKTRKTKTGWTTDAEALADLYDKTSHPFLEALLRHRDFTKLTQMVDGLRAEIKPDGRIHTTFLQTATATGRLASAEPNLQNIPTRTDTGMRIREAFIAGPAFADLMSVDYSQIEMRIMAHLSGDEGLIDAFNSGEDLHRTMAAMVFSVPITEVTPELRSRIKATSYGLAYGLSPYGLSRQLGVGFEEARELHSQYFQRFGGVGQYLHEVVETARETGYTETMFGRRRYFPDLQATNHRIREMAERAALNAPIQGSAADIMKIATIKVENRLLAEGCQSRIILQIHDELLLEIAHQERDRVEQILREEMASPVEMSVPLEVAVGVGKSWMSAAH